MGPEEIKNYKGKIKKEEVQKCVLIFIFYQIRKRTKKAVTK